MPAVAIVVIEGDDEALPDFVLAAQGMLEFQAGEGVKAFLL